MLWARPSKSNTGLHYNMTHRLHTAASQLHKSPHPYNFMSHFWQIYEQELYMLGHGLPIWHAEPFNVRQEVHVGDVGYMEEGRFRRVFNVFYGDTRLTTATDEDQASPDTQPFAAAAFQPATYEAPFPNNYGVPENHIPPVMPVYEFDTHSYISKGWRHRTDCNMVQITPRACAALMLRTDGECCKASESLFEGYSNLRWKQWRTFTFNQDAHRQHADTLMFVYGHTKTSAWSTVADERRHRSGKLEFDVELPALGSAGLAYQQSWGVTTSPHVNHGPWKPQPETEGSGMTRGPSTAAGANGLKRNQTVFLRRIMTSDKSALDKLRYRVWVWYNVGKQGKGTPSPAHGYSQGNSKQSESTLRSRNSTGRGIFGMEETSETAGDPFLTQTDLNDIVSSEEFYVDPLEELLLYILEAEQSAIHAVVSDDHAISLLKVFSSFYDTRLPDNMSELLSELRPETMTDEYGIAHLCVLNHDPCHTQELSTSKQVHNRIGLHDVQLVSLQYAEAGYKRIRASSPESSHDGDGAPDLTMIEEAVDLTSAKTGRASMRRPGKKARGTGMACNRCRLMYATARNIKCGSARPVCSPCAAAGIEGLKSTRKSTTKLFVDSLNNMVKVLKKRIFVLEGRLEATRRTSNHVYGMPANELLQADAPESSYVNGNPVVTVNEDEVMQEDSDIEQLCAPTEHLRLDKEEPQFYRPFSIFGPVPQEASSPQASRDQQLAENQASSYDLPWGDGTDQPNIDWSRHLPLDVALTRAEHDRILGLFFRFFTSWGFRIIPELFLHDMCRSLSTPLGQIPPRTAHYSPMLHNALLSITTTFSDDPEVKKTEARRKFAIKARDRLEEECKQPDLSVILALSILSDFHLAQYEQILGYMYFGISARMSQALGLAVDCKPWVAKGLISEDNMNDRDWVYWTTFCQDTTLSLYVGRDFCVSSLSDRQQIHIPFVGSPLDQLMWDWPGQSSRPNYIPSTFAATCDLLQIARQILDVVSNFSRMGLWQALDDYHVGQMDLKLHTWKNNLSPEVDLSKLTFGSAMPHQLMLQMTYHWLSIVLHRPFYRKKRSVDKRVFEVDHMKLCDKATHDIMDLATKWRELYSLRYVPITFIQVVSAAGTIFIQSAVQSISSVPLASTAYQNSYGNAEKTVQYLHEIGQSFQSAHNIGNILDNRLKEQAKARDSFPDHSPTTINASMSPPQLYFSAPNDPSPPNDRRIYLQDPFNLIPEQQYYRYGETPQNILSSSNGDGYPMATMTGQSKRYGHNIPDLRNPDAVGMGIDEHHPNIPYIGGSPERRDFDPEAMERELLELLRNHPHFF
ncbi:hypothetical protein EVG20_g3777 [Dentipellis fragilis]|uniref:Xylanolytic transcriptional activator regulatory domain-containing protein n=1 Tax=Dentipellis fragilis TaxID=205917 RepID=A0A4Y9YZ35_9AGAM|nr:hypothetical protein EVG20_g3777 [Dentipellis fragilis]